jgi:hypothetical protein
VFGVACETTRRSVRGYEVLILKTGCRGFVRNFGDDLRMVCVLFLFGRAWYKFSDSNLNLSLFSLTAFHDL